MAASVLALAATAVAADDLDNIGNLNQSQFDGLSQDLAAAFSYKAGASAEALGVIGFDVGVAVTSTDLEHPDAWTAAMSSGDTIDTLIIPKLYVQKGLPFDIDVGGYYFTVPDSNIDAWGAEIKYSIISGNVALPAVALRGSFTTLDADDQLELDSQSVDVSISKGILMLTPYAGIGRVWAESTPKAGSGLQTVDISETRTFIGVTLHPPLFNLALERDSVGGIVSYNLKFGLAF
jgi:hypothetical protein